jgi:ABC-type polar amino acid transport system ATPase subunit
MKEYDVCIDVGSYSTRVKANSKEEAEEKAIKEFENMPIEDRTEEYWVGDCDEVTE